MEKDQHLLYSNEILIRKDTLPEVSGLKAINKIEAVNRINEKINTEIFNKLLGELEPLYRQKPNRRLVGIVPFHLSIYNIFNQGKERKWKNWFKNTVGEAPVIFDSLLALKTRDQLELFLKTKGYFNAKVGVRWQLKKNKLATVQYDVVTGNAYTIKDVKYNIKDEGLRVYEDQLKQNSLLTRGENFENEKLVKERDRLASVIKNEGHFFFGKEYIYYSIDSSLGSEQVDVTIGINQINQNSEDTLLLPTPHQKYYVGDVEILTDYNPKAFSDSVKQNSMTYRGIKVFFAGKKPKIKPQVLYRAIYLRKGELFQLRNQEQTYVHFGDLGIFKFTGIKYQEMKSDTAPFNRLNCLIQLTTSYKQGISYVLEGTNTGGNLGIGGNISYRNKNMFRGAELLELKFSGGVEAQQFNLFGQADQQADPISVFNTVEVNPEISLAFPKFIIPWRVKTGKNTRPKTMMNLSYNHQIRTDYIMTVAKISLDYQWNESQTKRWIVSPVSLSLIDIKNESIRFQEYLDSTTNTIRYAYNSHLVPAMRITYILNTQDITRTNSFWYFRVTLESAGNLFYLANKVYNAMLGSEGTSYVLRYKNIDYSQFLRPDIELKHYMKINVHNTVVYRVAGGIGIPYLNTKPQVMPFDKTFSGGGANDLRGWQIRSIGPGSDTTQTNHFEQTGDIKLIGNVEYRFDFVKFLQGAVFVDAGNVWMRNDTIREGAQFRTKNGQFLTEIGIDGGVGLRLNFSFFVLRVDYAVQLRSPSEPYYDRWVVTNTRLNKLLGRDYSHWQFGIGFPF